MEYKQSDIKYLSKFSKEELIEMLKVNYKAIKIFTEEFFLTDGFKNLANSFTHNDLVKQVLSTRNSLANSHKDNSKYYQLKKKECDQNIEMLKLQLLIY